MMLRVSTSLLKMTVRDKISGVLSPISLVFIGIIIIALLLGMISGLTGFYILVIVIGIGIIVIAFLLQQDVWLVALMLALRLYIDWYLGLQFVALTIQTVLLITYLLSRPPRVALKLHNILWIWLLLLLLSIIPTLRAPSLLDGAYYYFNVIFYAFVMFYLGATLIHNVEHFRRLLRSLSFYSTFIAVLTIIQFVTGKLWFSSTRYDTYLTRAHDFALIRDLAVFRIGSFFVNPNSSGAFFAMMLLLPLGLIFESSTFFGKALYFIELFILLPALICSYSTGAWISLCIGIVVFLLFVGKAYYRFLLLLLIAGFTITMVTVFPSQVAIQLWHAEEPNEIISRSGAWQTGLQVIRAFPLSGLGLGSYVYIQRAEPYRSIEQSYPLDHPHDSLLELAALGGLPLAFVFTVLFLLASWLALCGWRRSDIKARPLIAGGIASVAALTMYSVSDAGWTLAPLLAPGWLLLGAMYNLWRKKDK